MHQLVTLCETEDFLAKAEVIDNILFLHCDVKRNTVSSLKSVREGFSILKEEAYLHGWDEMYTYTQNGRWVRLIGGQYQQTVIVNDKEYEVYKWEVK